MCNSFFLKCRVATKKENVEFLQQLQHILILKKELHIRFLIFNHLLGIYFDFIL